MKLAVTGHRPPKLNGYGEEAQIHRIRLAKMQLTALKPTEVITGMALGWDQAIAYAAHSLGIPYHAAVPFHGQEAMWPLPSQEYYRRLLLKAQTISTVSAGGYHPRKMQVRNEWMVQNSDALLALWDGSDGGTGNCVKYAQAVNNGRFHQDEPPYPIHNCWSKWLEIIKEPV